MPAFSQPLSSRLRADLLVCLVLIATGLGIYGQTLNYPFITLDDYGYVIDNTHVNHGLTWEGWKWAWTSLEQSNWHPLTWLSLMLDAQLYGLNAGGYHLTNLLLHLTNSVLVFVWLRKATDAFWPSVLTAFFFVVHPLHVESVAWVTERKDVLSAFFFFLTLIAFLFYVQRRERRFYWLSVGLYAVGLTAKPMLITLPCLLCLLDFWPLQRIQRIRWQRLVLEKTPFFVLAVLSSVMTVIAQRAVAIVALGNLPLEHRFFSALLGYGSYLQKTFLPWNLGVYYPYWHNQLLVWPFVWLAVLTLVTAGCAFLWRKLPFLLVGWAWFLGMLVPVIGVVQVGGQAFADRYAYLPHVGLFIALSWTLAAAWDRWKAARPVVTVTVTGAALACTLLCYQQTAYWRSNATLFEHTTKVVAPSPRVYHLLADAWLEAHETQKATAVYRLLWQTGALESDKTELVGTLLLQADDWSEAIGVLDPWTKRAEATPSSLNNLAYALRKAGRDEEAVAAYRRCMERFPNYARAHFGLAELLHAQGNTGEADVQDAAGLTLQGDCVPALIRLARDRAHEADRSVQQSALSSAQRAVDLTGGRDLGGLNVLAFAQAVNGNWQQAVNTADQAVELANRAGKPAEETARTRAQLEDYQRGVLPP